MFHLVIFIISFITLFISTHYNLLSKNIDISLSILGLIAGFRYLFWKEIKMGELILENAKRIETLSKTDAKSANGKVVFQFEEESQMLPGFQDFAIRFDDGFDRILSTSKLEFIELLKKQHRCKFFYIENIIVDIENITEEKES